MNVLQYIFSLRFSEKPKKNRTYQSTLKAFYFVCKETTHKPSKVATAKIIFSQCVFYWYNLLS